MILVWLFSDVTFTVLETLWIVVFAGWLGFVVTATWFMHKGVYIEPDEVEGSVES